MTKGLNWSQRNSAINTRIESAYNRISGDTKSIWGMNGAQSYGLNGVSDDIMIEKIILEGLKNDQKEFAFMEIGAGNFQWGRSITEFINKNPLFQKEEINVTIYSLRGEKNENDEVVSDGICKRYEYGNFKIENLNDQLTEKGHSLINKIDLIVSSWCFRHLADPTGTLMQAYAQLRPNTGVIFVDGFFLALGDQSLEDILSLNTPTLNMQQLLDNFDTPFAGKTDRDGRRIDCFFIQKKSSDIPNLDIEYKDFFPTETFCLQLGSDTITSFKKGEKWKEKGFDNYELEIVGRKPFFYLPQYHEFFSSIVKDFSIIKEKIVDTALSSLNDESSFEYSAKVIYELLMPLIEFDNKSNDALECIDALLTANEGHALRILNHLSNEGDSILKMALKRAFSLYSSGQSDCALVNKLVTIAPTEILNSKDYPGRSEQLNIREKATEYNLSDLVGFIDGVLEQRYKTNSDTETQEDISPENKAIKSSTAILLAEKDRKQSNIMS